MTTSTTTVQTPRTKRRALTNTNTDVMCSSSDGIFSKWVYRFNLWTGLYMLNPYERFVLYLLGGFTLLASLTYFVVFWRGFTAGVMQASESVLQQTPEEPVIEPLIQETEL
eukprot:Nitzschia sp. Nitz4//scaffold84_size84139//45414//45746//NITZ4_005200-RA/size84139-processed-gene-0.99-mRNA-1//-1//CDS//3329559039//828//frame0